MIPLAIPNLCGNEKKYLIDCVDTNFVSSVGPYVDRFEKSIAEASGAKYGVATASGTSALHLALKSLGVGSGDLVITPSYTFVATVNSIIHSGAEPWLFDVRPISGAFNLDSELVENELRKNTHFDGERLIHVSSGKRVAAIMPVYFNGQPADMINFRRISKDYKLPIVADGAAAIGAKYESKAIAEFANFTAFSFNGNKIVTSGGGGALVTNNETLARKARHLCTTARVGTDYIHDEVGFNFRMTNIEAAVGCGQIENLQKFISIKRSIQKKYNEAFKASDTGLVPLTADEQLELGTCWLSGVLLDPDRHPKTDKVVTEMALRGITVRAFWIPVHLQKPYAGFMRTDMSVCEGAWSKVLCLPCSTQLAESEQNQVVRSLIEVIKEA